VEQETNIGLSLGLVSGWITVGFKLGLPNNCTGYFGSVLGYPNSGCNSVCYNVL